MIEGQSRRLCIESGGGESASIVAGEERMHRVLRVFFGRRMMRIMRQRKRHGVNVNEKHQENK